MFLNLCIAFFFIGGIIAKWVFFGEKCHFRGTQKPSKWQLASFTDISSVRDELDRFAEFGIFW